MATLLDQMENTERKRKSAAMADYRALVDRAYQPQDGDAELLDKTFAATGFTPEQFKADVSAWREAMSNQRNMSTREQRAEAYARNEAAVALRNKRLPELEKEREEILNNANDCWNRLQQIDRSDQIFKGELARIKQARPHLFAD